MALGWYLSHTGPTAVLGPSRYSMALWGGVGSVDTQVVQLCGPGGLLGWNPEVGLLRGVLEKGLPPGSATRPQMAG